MASKKITDYEVAKKLCNLHDSAKDRQIPFGLSYKRVKQMLQADRCYFTGILFDDTKNIRSIDRVEAKDGYFDHNTVPCVEWFNRRKANLTVTDIEMLYEGVVKYKKKLSKIQKNATITSTIQQ